jgi:hypothetical protein
MEVKVNSELRRFHKHSFDNIFLPLLICLAMVSASSKAGDNTILDLSFAGKGGNQCDNSHKWVVYAGSIVDFVVTVLPDGNRPAEVQYSGVSDWSWPSGLKISAGKILQLDDSARAPEQLGDLLHLEYYVTANQARDDRIWRTKGVPALPLSRAPEYHFAFRVPEELTGQYLCFDVEWNHPRYGHLISREKTCTKVINPCSDAAAQMVRRTYVYEAWWQGRYDRAITVADSLIALGWHDLNGLFEAQCAARDAKRYDDALRFLDICFETNHTVTPEFRGRREQLTQPTPATIQEYQRIRSQLMDLKNQNPQH